MQRIRDGDESAKEQLIDLVYDELHGLASGLMRGERDDHTLQTTALVHEASLRILQKDGPLELQNRKYFFGVMATTMRRVLVDHARKKRALRRGADARRVPLDLFTEGIERQYQVDLVDLDEALQTLEAMSPRQCQVVTLRFFGGYEMREIATHLQVSLATVEKDWRIARAWLRQKLT